VRHPRPALTAPPARNAGTDTPALDLCADGRGLGFAGDSAVTDYLRPGVTFVGLSDVEDARTALCWRADERDPAVLAYVATARAVADLRSS
jgi:DNA-binding transcriptional LysR family regulator